MTLPEKRESRPVGQFMNCPYKILDSRLRGNDSRKRLNAHASRHVFNAVRHSQQAKNAHLKAILAYFPLACAMILSGNPEGKKWVISIIKKPFSSYKIFPSPGCGGRGLGGGGTRFYRSYCGKTPTSSTSMYAPVFPSKVNRIEKLCVPVQPVMVL